MNNSPPDAPSSFPIDFGDKDAVVLLLLQSGALSPIMSPHQLSYYLGTAPAPPVQNRDVVASLGSSFTTAMKRLALGFLQNDAAPKAPMGPKAHTGLTAPSPPQPQSPPQVKPKAQPRFSPPPPKPKPPTRTVVYYGTPESMTDIQF